MWGLGGSEIEMKVELYQTLIHRVELIYGESR
jgi:hypothetical protein